MQYITTTYAPDELAWVSPEITLTRNIFMTITLKQPGKLVIRQDNGDGKKLRVPIKKHKDTKEFTLRMQVVPDSIKIQIFTSTEPKEIKYAYI